MRRKGKYGGDVRLALLGANRGRASGRTEIGHSFMMRIRVPSIQSQFLENKRHKWCLGSIINRKMVQQSFAHSILGNDGFYH